MKVGTTLERLLTGTGYVRGFRLRCPASREKIDNRFESAGDSDFAEDVLKVCFDGIARETELVRHLLVRLAEDQQIDNLLFPLSQVQPREVRGGQRQSRRLTSTQTGQDNRMQVGQIGGSDFRSEERRVGKEGRSRGSPYH